MKDLSGLIVDLRELSDQARDTADQLERLQGLQDTELKWTMSVEEVATALGVNTSTVYEYARQRLIPHVRVGKRLIIPRAALMNWLDSASEQTRRSQAG